MPTPAERKALSFLAGLVLLGAGVRAVRAVRASTPPDPAARVALARQIAAVDSVRREGRSRNRPRRAGGKQARSGHDSRQRPNRGDTVFLVDLSPRHAVAKELLVDLDIASAEEIERLPRIGPVLAARIVADRDSLGPFGSLAGFQRVKGVGAAMAKALAPRVTFSLQSRPSRVGERVRPPPAREKRRRSP